jgi:glycerol-3-phosphate acyltransferase PlsX
MQGKIVISLDAMGGDNAPDAIVYAADRACQELSDIHFIIYGKEAEVAPILKGLPRLSQYAQFIPTISAVNDDDKPVQALRNGIESSMRKAIDAVANKSAHACVSAGNTGALMVMAKKALGELPGIKRPAIIGVFPNRQNGTVILDMGANSECDENILLQFAHMGTCFARAVLEKEKPSVGILNIGTEEVKGRVLEKNANSLFKQCPHLNYIGFVEGHHVTNGEVDVVVTDGFTGNIAVKFSEGTAKLCMDILKDTFNTNWYTKLGGVVLKPFLQKNFSEIDPSHKNGAMFIGVNGIVVKSHGSSGIKRNLSAIKVAYALAKQEINEKIITELGSLKKDNIGYDIVSKIKKTFGMES